MRLATAALLLSLLACACTRPPPRPVGQNGGDAGRAVVFAKGDPRHAVFEGPTFQNACAGDPECHVGGCSGEVCTAEEGVVTACMAHEDQPRDATCGCVQGECVWYRAQGNAVERGLAEQGMPCPDGRCAPGLTCVGYYGIAGPRGPHFTSCEMKCGPTSKCPPGQTCVSIADGPGSVCRPRMAQ